MQRAERVVGLACIGIGAFMIWQGWLLQFYTKLGPGPGFFPLCMGVILSLLSGLWLLSVLRQSEHAVGARFLPDRRGALRIAAIMGGFAAAAALLEVVGFQLAMFVFVGFVYRALGGRSWALTLLLALGLSAGVFQSFTRWLDVTLPQASIEGLRTLGL